ncbi:unnamed protein product [Owenia fusiformis]|uniref:Uncharacterized protein n=1 Tax=Owenia fusiformis TaxID=6347 RepID=A0A8J1U9L6_OWEFU|nr:unnamed protein product [Owenia fusiformis]
MEVFSHVHTLLSFLLAVLFLVDSVSSVGLGETCIDDAACTGTVQGSLCDINSVCVCDRVGHFIDDSNGGCVCDAANQFVSDGGDLCVCDAAKNFADDGNGGCACDAAGNYVDDGNGVCVCDEANGFGLRDDACKLKVDIDGDCSDPTTTFCSDPNSNCDGTSSKCACNADYENKEGVCKRSVAIGGDCSDTTTFCVDANSNCDNQNTCECNTQYEPKDDVCKLRVVAGGNCSDAATTFCVDANSNCDGTACVCNADWVNRNSICKEDKAVGTECNTVTSYCVDGNSSCSDDGTGTSKCLCNDGWDQRADGQGGFLCQVPKQHGEACDTGNAPFDYCVNDNALCDSVNAKCVCDSANSWEWRPAAKKCQQPKLVGEACDKNTSYCTDSFAKCGDITSSGSDSCECDEVNLWFSKDEAGVIVCKRRTFVGKICDEKLSFCDDTNSLCKDDGWGSSVNRCICKEEYLAVKADNGTYQCALKITGDSCRQCEDNLGQCYDTDGDEQRDGCVCPSSRSGDDCTISHVSVKCTRDSMSVCYKPHEGIDFSGGASVGATMYPYGYKTIECLAIPASGGDECEDGNQLLKISIKDVDLARCGIKVLNEPGLKKYETLIVVQRNPNSIDSNDISFRTYCTFDDVKQLSFEGIGVLGVPGNSNGDHLEADIRLSVVNALGQEIPTGVALRLGDSIELVMSLADDGTYGSMKVERCTISSESEMPSTSAVTIPVITDGCPTDNQDHITNENTFKRIEGSTHYLKTGPIEVFKPSRGTSSYVHCTVKLCLTKNEEQCKMTTCPAKSGGNRRKRAVDSASATVKVGWKVFGEGIADGNTDNTVDTPVNTGTTPVVVGAICGVLLVCLAAILVLGAIANRRRKRKAVDAMELKTTASSGAIPEKPEPQVVAYDNHAMTPIVKIHRHRINDTRINPESLAYKDF